MKTRHESESGDLAMAFGSGSVSLCHVGSGSRRGTSRGAARRLLTDHAEYGHWELARLRLFADGSRKVVLRPGRD